MADSFDCDPCDFHSTVKANYERHLKTPKHLAGGKKPAKEYSCDECAYTTTNRGNFYTHQKSHGVKKKEPQDPKMLWIMKNTQLSSRRVKLRGLTLDLKKKGVDRDAIQQNIDQIQQEIGTLEKQMAEIKKLM